MFKQIDETTQDEGTANPLASIKLGDGLLSYITFIVALLAYFQWRRQRRQQQQTPQ